MYRPRRIDVAPGQDERVLGLEAAGLDARALLEEVAAFVDQLPPKQRVALTVRKYHELGYAEIATESHASGDRSLGHSPRLLGSGIT